MISCYMEISPTIEQTLSKLHAHNNGWISHIKWSLDSW